MGTDMHVLIEVNHGDGWRALRKMTPHQVEREYVLFSMLGDIRNKSGRGTRTWQEPEDHVMEDGETITIGGYWYDTDDGGHEHINPIDAPRGVPVDCSEEWGLFASMWAPRAHAYTYLSMEDIVGGDWDQPVTRYGAITEEEYLNWRDNGVLPTTFASDAGGPGTAVVPQHEYEAGKRGEKYTYVYARWQAGTTGDICRVFLETMKDLKEITELRPQSSLRLMVLFES
jgi:hypothetical protein